MRMFVSLAACVLLLPMAGPVQAAEPDQSAALTLRAIDSRTAIVLLRTIVGAKLIVPVDEKTVQVTGAAEVVQLSRSVIELAEDPKAVESGPRRLATADGTEITSVRIERAAKADVVTALRSELALARFAVDDARPVLVLRDTPEQLDAAMAMIRELEERAE